MLTVVTNLYGSEQDKARAIKVAALRAAQKISPALEAAVATAAEAASATPAAAESTVTEAKEDNVVTSGDAVSATPLASALPPTQWWEVPAQQVFGGGDTFHCPVLDAILKRRIVYRLSSCSSVWRHTGSC